MDANMPLLQTFRKPTMENVRLLEEYVNKDAMAICAKGQDKIIIPAIVTMIAELPDIRNKNEVITRLVNTAAKVINLSRIDTLMSHQTILMILIKNIAAGPDFMSIHSNLSEEFKLAIVNCIECIFRRTTSNVVAKFYTKDNLNLLAQILSINEIILAKENYKPLRLAAVKCMLSVFQLHTECAVDIKRQYHQIANCTFLLIPKIISTLANVATGDCIVGQTLIARSIEAIYRILNLIFTDYTMQASTAPNMWDFMKKPPKTLNPPHAVNSSSQTVDDKLNALKSTERNDGWLTTASIKLCPIIRRLKNLASLNSTSIRRELFQLSDTLLRNCQRNMNACIPALLEINICINENFEQHHSLYSEDVIDVAEVIFADLLLNLPRTIYTGDESEQMVGFSQLEGVIRLLHATNRLKITISNDEIMEKFIGVLLVAIELERDNRLLEMNSCHNYDISESTTAYTENQSIAVIPPWKNYKNLRTGNLIHKIHNTCKCISEHHQTYALILEYLLKLLAKNACNCNEALLLIQIFVSAAVTNADSSSAETIACNSLYAAMLEELGCLFRWQLQTHIDDQAMMNDKTVNTYTDQWYEDRVEGLYESAISIRLSQIPTEHTDSITAITLKDIKNNILHICLVMETIGYYAKQNHQAHHVFFMKMLPRLIEHSSSEHYVIREAALMALVCLRHAFNLDTMADLILMNADYVTQSINTSLKHPDQIDNALRILNTATFYNSIESIPHLEGVVHNMIAESCKLSQSKNTLSFMHAFKCILSNIRVHNVRPKAITDESNEHLLATVRNHFTEWSNILTGAIAIIPDGEDDNEDDEPPHDEGENAQPADTNEVDDNADSTTYTPPHIHLTVDIIKQCIPLIASINVDVKLMALECVTIGLDVIKDTEHELLPIVHLIWDPFMQQYMRNKNPVVLRYSFEFLRQVACHAKEFIHQRSSKQLLPNINQYLNELSKDFTRDRQHHLYEHSQEVKALKEILIGLPAILKALNVQERDLNNVLDAVSWAMKKKKPRFLREVCETFISELESFDMCTVYVKLFESN